MDRSWAAQRLRRIAIVRADMARRAPARAVIGIGADEQPPAAIVGDHLVEIAVGRRRTGRRTSSHRCTANG